MKAIISIMAMRITTAPIATSHTKTTTKANRQRRRRRL